MSDFFTDRCLKDRVAFVAGGSSGINLGIAHRFAAKGASVMLVSRTEERLRRAAETITSAGGVADWAVADVRDPAAVQDALARCASRFGPIDIVLSGAAGNFLAPVTGLSSNGFKTVVDIDLLGTYNVFKHSYPHLRKPGAALLTITAPQAVMAMEQQAHVGAAKAGVNQLTRILAKEWGPEGIRVNAISPGYIEGTEGVDRLLSAEARVAATTTAIPLRRLGQLDDIADTALFLVGDNAAYITGTIVYCDGGLVLGKE